MELRQILMVQLEREVAATRRAIERVPEGRNDWRPHEKSMPLGYLAALVATMPGWVEFMIERDELNLDNPASEQFKTKVLETRAQIMQKLEEGFAKAQKAPGYNRRTLDEAIAV